MMATDDEESGTNPTSLLGDGVEVRAQLQRIKEQVEVGPKWLKLFAVAVCGIAAVYDVVSIFAELIKLEPFQMINTAYAGTFAAFGAALELQQSFLPDLRRWVNVWIKVLNRTWGKGVFHLLTGGLHIAIRSTFGYVVGIGLVLSGIAALLVSRHAGSKLGALHAKIVAGHTEDMVYVRQVFNRQDTDRSGYLTCAELASAAKELGTEFTAGELVAIFDYLDFDGDGKLSYDEFEAFWRGSDRIAWERVPLV